ncbi:hypothetical protein DPMN_156914 [Dreissena polymorpha]|uniref:Uncharacterized protein n=1 Tax=Dreissena polymorpha TaxID=45954 RepID=A0A9D4FQM2_DREPO|nr:hypothetical protein DPMN_156914 [Dreissena polymorpha]
MCMILDAYFQKRQRKDFSELELGVLEAAWLEGMTSTKKECQPQILDVASKLQTTSERIQVKYKPFILPFDVTIGSL